MPYLPLQGEPVVMDEHQKTVLLCPRCGFNYLHQEGVDVYDREEDAEVGQHVTVVRGTTTVSDKATPSVGNPSSRRHGLVITFTCEGCANTPHLSIYQHKGQTYIEWLE